jgi:hypothetical protein
MDNVQNCDSYINIPSSQTYRSYIKGRKQERNSNAFSLLTWILWNIDNKKREVKSGKSHCRQLECDSRHLFGVEKNKTSGLGRGKLARRHRLNYWLSHMATPSISPVRPTFQPLRPTTQNFLAAFIPSYYAHPRPSGHIQTPSTYSHPRHKRPGSISMKCARKGEEEKFSYFSGGFVRGV